MKARLRYEFEQRYDDGAIVEMVLWEVPQPIFISADALVVDLLADVERRGFKCGERPPSESSAKRDPRALGRDVKSVHRDVHALIALGLVTKDSKSHVLVRFSPLRTEFDLVSREAA